MYECSKDVITITRDQDLRQGPKFVPLWDATQC